MGSIPGSRRSPGRGNGNALQYSCLENPMEQGSLAGYSPWGRKESDTAERLHFHFHLGFLFVCAPISFPMYPFFCCPYGVAVSCPTLCDPHRLQPARLLCPWDSPGKNTGAGCHSFLQGILLTQGSPAVAGRLFTTEPPGKPILSCLLSPV